MNICITVLAIPLQILDRFPGDRFVQSGDTGRALARSAQVQR
jgi:hypothetical protein